MSPPSTQVRFNMRDSISEAPRSNLKHFNSRNNSQHGLRTSQMMGEGLVVSSHQRDTYLDNNH